MSKFLSRILIATTLVLGFSGTGFAQGYNCQNPSSQQAMNLCAGQEFAAADRVLNKVYAGAIAFMRQMDTGQLPELVGAEAALRQAQRDWIRFRDGACSAEGFLFRGGTMEPLVVATCLTRLTNRRISDLKVLEDMSY